MDDATGRRSDTRSKIVEVAARLLREHGPAAVTTRGVAEAAGVQAAAIYRLFGDKDSLLEAVAEHTMATYVSAKEAVVAAAAAGDLDPLEDLRAGWQTQIDFGLTNPELFRLLSDPDRVRQSPAALSGRRVLEVRVQRLASAGLLRVSETRAVDLIQAAGIGVIQTLLSRPPEHRDSGFADALLEAILGHILTDAPPVETGPEAAAIAFRTIAPHLDVLTEAERGLLVQWLDRAIGASQTVARQDRPTRCFLAG